MALNSIANLSASITANGKLNLQTSNAQSLTVAEVAGNGSPLAELGLTAGTTQASVVGTQQVQVGTEEVVVSQEQYVTGQEQYVTGQEQSVSGQEQYVAGTHQVQVGTEEVVVGTEQVQTGTSEVSLGSRSLLVGFDRVQSSAAADPTASAAFRDSLQSLVSAVGALASSPGGAMSPSVASGLVGDAQTFAANLSALLKSADFDSLGDASDPGARDRVIEKLNDALSQAKALGAKVAASSNHLDLAGQLRASLNATLLGQGQQSLTSDPVGLARRAADGLRGSAFGITSSHRMSVWS